MERDVEIYVSNKSGVPLHRQIYESIRRKIMSGELKEGDALPPQQGIVEVGADAVLQQLG